jgi:hypothetical protein
VRAKTKKNEEYNDILAQVSKIIRNFVGRITINDKRHHDEKNDFVGRSGFRYDYRYGSEQ